MRMRALVVALVGSAICVGALVAEDLPAMFRMKVEDAQGFVVEAMHGGRPSWMGYEFPFEQAKGEARAALVKTVLKWAKDYTESEAYATKYASERKRLEPRAPYQRPPADEVLARQKADLDYRIATEKRRLEMAPPRNQTPEQIEAGRKAAETRLQDYTTRRARFDDAQAFAEMRNKLEAPVLEEKREYESARAKWEENYPPDFRTLIAKQLRAFLSETADVDFSAKLVPCAAKAWMKHKCFANPTFEKKSLEWKACFRAGKPSLDAARSFATNWLNEVEKASPTTSAQRVGGN